MIVAEKNFTILIIEDQKFCVDLFRAAFGQYDIIAAHSGADGIQAYQDKKPDMVFLDIGLPDMSGFDVLAKLRLADPNAYIVMLSAMNSEAYIKRCRELGAAGFLTKPYQKDYIEHYIAECKAQSG